MDEVTSGTPKVLKEYLQLLSSPSHETFVEVGDDKPLDRYLNHPDIQYFRRIKSKNHYNYHKTKNNSRTLPQRIAARAKMFDPYNRNNLLERLSTFTALNWSLPFTGDECEVNELLCARNGWRCVSILSNNNVKNHLRCSSCNHQLVLKFNDISTASAFVPFDFDTEDYHELNMSLISLYYQQILTGGHDASCPWINFETPLEGVYYPRPYIGSTNELLTKDYLSNLKNLTDNVSVLDSNSEIFKESFLVENQDPKFLEFIKISNNWLLNRYYKDDKENFFNLLERIPRLFYKIAVLGWTLNIQSFSDQLVLLLICNKCNKRVFLNSAHHAPVNKHNTDESLSAGMNLSASKILTPCEFPPMIGINEQHDSVYSTSGPDDEFDELEKYKFDVVEEHKSWCCNIKPIDDKTSLYQYFMDMVTSNKNINDEEVLYNDSEIDVDSILSSNHKRKQSFDINDGLDRFHKLRKLYLVDNHPK